MKDSWINPSGVIIEVSDSHDEFARELLSKEMSRKQLREFMDINNLNYPYEVLHLRGWVRVKVSRSKRICILGDCVNLTRIERNTIDPRMNSAQIKTAKMICKDANTLFIDAVNDRRFW